MCLRDRFLYQMGFQRTYRPARIHSKYTHLPRTEHHNTQSRETNGILCCSSPHAVTATAMHAIADLGNASRLPKASLATTPYEYCDNDT
jgi:hypothetical protein